MKLTDCRCHWYRDFADQLYGTFAGVDTVGIGVHATRSSSTRQSSVFLHIADSGAHAGARESMSTATKQGLAYGQTPAMATAGALWTGPILTLKRVIPKTQRTQVEWRMVRDDLITHAHEEQGTFSPRIA